MIYRDYERTKVKQKLYEVVKDEMQIKNEFKNNLTKNDSERIEYYCDSMLKKLVRLKKQLDKLK